MFRIAKNLVKTLEQSVQDFSLSQSSDQLDAFFQSIPPNLLLAQFQQHQNQNGNEQECNNEVDYSIRKNYNDTVSGLRIVYVDETQLQLQSYFDYIVGINDDPLPFISNQHGYVYPDYNKIASLFNEKCNDYIKLNVWSAKGGVFRDVYMSVPQKDPSNLEDVSLEKQENNVSHQFQPLGFKVQWSPLIASTFTYHILNLNINQGPAQLSGLIPDEDYIIGCQDGLLATGGETLLQDIVRSRANHDLVLYVYNKVEDCVRPITVNIGGDGRLGCNVGYGFLHRIPTVTKNQQNQNQHEQQHQQHQQPAVPEIPPQSESAFTPKNLNSAPPITHKKKTKQQQSGTSTMGSYFDEGKDVSAVISSDSSIPPPPVKN
ncbi:hypothetical protein Kpol_2002p31 [Vanderwaltozyma polyspora DSM 70294]|uniref:PDZ GRASP-type domain-containing protein n=1 Tax=Vanderwaltozyma polyspora (strain ATCC 22028 / DSM 70294 / BCRC 21397 / CBS 2163 / NBRC 10782 / NRRL Y-8283 / UCD 57-17) TaxID=436907 RepID=A7TFE7_VANPO|nr:uncharacterized protein Kpol_2002p31 [Vanderwaltozyma polyspora DSM 70294]EDO18961.1 hypothetical protein Kpol_2002p31 [Vanderwaltozyma polyspora DSM 70294]